MIRIKLPLNSERGDSFSQLNVRVSKFFKWGENKKLGLFFEAFNVFNTGNFGNQFQNVTGDVRLRQANQLLWRHWFFRAARNSVPGSIRRSFQLLETET